MERPPKSRPESIDDDLKVFLIRHVERESVGPFTAETFAQMAGELETAYRLAWLKRQTAPSTATEEDRPSPHQCDGVDHPPAA